MSAKGKGRRWPTVNEAGIFGVGLAAAALSFDTLKGLAGLLAYPWALTYLYPLAYDLYGLIVARVWLAAGAQSKKLRNWAMWNTMLSIALSVAANALYHALINGLWTKVEPGLDGQPALHVAIPVVIAASAIPPIALGLVIHLYTVMTREQVESAQTVLPTPSPTADGPMTAPSLADAAAARTSMADTEILDAEVVDELSATSGSSQTRAAIESPEASKKSAVVAELIRLRDEEGVSWSRRGLVPDLARQFDVSRSLVEQAKTVAAKG